MKVPKSCQAWKEMMTSGKRERLILANVEKDSCLDGQVEAAFFDQLAQSGSPKDAKEALEFAQQVVKDDPDHFVCQGRNVPEDLFVRLFRFQGVSSLRHALPASFLDSIGYRDKDLFGDIDEEDLRSFTDQYDGRVSLGNRLQVVWPTDFAEIEDRLADLPSLVNLLGIGAHRYILCVYNREGTGTTLHVPRALDGIDLPLFQVVDDPTADHGWTKPAGGSDDDGLPEAVHRSCSIVPERWELGKSQ